MAKRTRQWTDQYVEELIGNLLRVGVTLAAAVVLFGGIVYLFRHGLRRLNITFSWVNLRTCAACQES